MTDNRDKASTEPAAGGANASTPATPAAISRRAMIRGASIALPTVLTLNSNAAFGWAVTSGTIGTRTSNPDSIQDAFCINGDQVPTKSGVYYLNGAQVIELPGSYQYRVAGTTDVISPDAACVLGGEIEYSSDGGGSWNPVNIPTGALISVTATQMASFTQVDYLTISDFV